MLRRLALFVLFVPAAAAQDVTQFFPLAPSDRWVYDVEGEVPIDTASVSVRAQSTWTVLDVRSSAEMDTVRMDVARVHADGARDRTECSFLTGRGGQLPMYGIPGSNPPPACKLAGGLPFSTRFAGLLNARDSLGAQEVEVGSETYDRQAEEWSFRANTSCQPRFCGSYQSEEIWVRATMVAGIGQVAMNTTHRLRRGCVLRARGYVCTTDRSDTLRVQLLGAEVGGVIYGDISPVATDPGPEPPAPILRVGPNPARASVTVWGADGAELTVFDPLGRLVRRHHGGAVGPVAVDMSGLPAGVYTIRSERGASTRVVIVR
ncbi:T9SS type A sorting domain-containing protein [Rubrivirga sp.]|uniref:T9SS type A sorting domain-containing protein n=1 Tax=Rubrivirga sp. TaxID=1885344 RepID=UPI003B515C39